MLRFATWKIIADSGADARRRSRRRPEHARAGEPASRCPNALPSWAQPRTIVLGLDLQGGSYVMLEVDKPSVLHTQVTNLRDDVRRILREEKVAITGGIGAQARGVQLRVPDAADRAKVLPKLRNLAQGFGAARLGGAPPLEVRERRRRTGPDRRHRRRRHRQGAPRGRPVDRGHPPPRRRARHERAEHSAPGRRPHPRAGARPAGPRAAQDHSRPDRQARVPPRRRARRRARPRLEELDQVDSRARSPSRSRSWCRARI